MSILNELSTRIDPERLAQTTLELVRIPSPTGRTRRMAEAFARIYGSLGCEVDILDEVAGAPPGSDAPSVAARLRGGGTGPVLHFDGHADTVPVEHSPPEFANGVVHGRGAADMKGGLASVMEMVRVFRAAGIELPGDLLMTVHGLHEAPTGHGEGLVALIDAGYRGDVAIVAEGPPDCLPIAGRGMAIFNVAVTGPAASTHENETPPGTPHPLVAAGELLTALEGERLRLSQETRPHVGCETIFVGQVHGGDFYNRFPTSCSLQGTRRYFETLGE